MPVVFPPTFLAVAIAWLSRFDAAVSTRSPLTATGSSVLPRISANVFETTTLTASEPATPTLLPPAPAPEVARAL